MIKINFNPSLLGIQSNLAKSTNALSVALERMSTGYKINSAKDDAAGLYVATRLNSRLSGLKVASDNVANALSMLNSAESSLVEMTNSLDRVRDLAVSASNGTYNAETRKMMQNEIDTLLSEVQRIQDNTTFNKLSVFTDTHPSVNNVKSFAGGSSAGKFVSEVNRLSESQAIAQGYTIIKTAEDLNNIRNDLGGKYILMGNIDLSSYDNWTPIGNSSNKFTGVLNGNGYVISNLTIDKASENDIGLFGACDGAELKNIGITTANVKGNQIVGILSGRCDNSSLIDNCFTSGVVRATLGCSSGIVGVLNTSSMLKNSYTQISSYSDGTVGYNAAIVGSLQTNSLVDNCFAVGDIIAINSIRNAGLVGYLYNSVIKNSYSLCNITVNDKVVGGIVGQSSANSLIENCFYNGTINADTTSYSYSGGICGEVNGTIRNCLSEGTIIARIGAGGILGMSNGNALVENCYSNMSIFSIGSVSGVTGIGLGGIGGVIQGNSIVRNCFSTGAVSSLIDNNVGGGFGRIGNNSLIENCFSTGTVVCDLYTDGFYGGLYGRIINNATIRNSAWCTDTSGITKDGSIQAGSATTVENIVGLTSSQLDSDFYRDNGFDEGIWDFSGGLPILRGLPDFGAYYTPDILRRLQIGEMSDFSSMIEVNTTMNLDLSGINVMTTESSKNAIDKIDELLKKISTKRSDIGVIVSNLELIKEQNMTTVENLTSAVSTIMDADIAEESAEYVKQRILNQTSSSLLSQASSMNNIALTMINRL